MPCVLGSLGFWATYACSLGVLPVHVEVCLGSTLLAGRTCSVFCLCRGDIPPAVFLVWEATLWEQVLGDEDGEGAVLHGFEERAVGERE